MTDVTTDSANLPSAGQFFEVGNYAPVPDEITEHNLPIEGAIPPEIDGWYLRNGPNPRKPVGHWFAGDGMIHGVEVVVATGRGAVDGLGAAPARGPRPWSAPGFGGR